MALLSSSQRSCDKYHIRLAPEQRAALLDLTRNGSAPAKKILHARVLLLADEVHPDGRRPDPYITDVLGIHRRTVVRIRQRFVQEGEGPALNRKPRITPPTPPKLDSRAEAFLVATCCGEPPAGHARWTLKLLAKELTRLEVVTSICPETVRRLLKKTNLSLGRSNGSAFRKRTVPASSPRWKKSSTSTRSRRKAASR
jgi:transposase